MVSIDDIDSDYITESYIAESGKITGVLSDISRVDNTLYVEFSIGEIQYSILVPPDIYTDSEYSLFRFVSDVKDDETSWSEFDLRDLIGQGVVLYVDESLNWIKFSEDGHEFEEKQYEPQELSESGIEDLNKGIQLWGQYISHRDSDFGWKHSIDAVDPVDEDTIAISVDTGVEVIDWEIDIPDTRSEDSAVVRFIDSVGSPKLLEGEYVTVVHESDTTGYTRVVEWSKDGEWALVIPEEFAEHKEYKSEQERKEKISDIVSTGKSIGVTLGKVGFVIGIVGIIILTIGFFAGEVNDAFSGDDPLASFDHEYPSGTLTVLLDSSVDEVIIQADGNQYEMDNPPSVIHLSASGSNSERTYQPGENVTVIAFTEDSSQTIHFDTSSQQFNTDVNDNDTTYPWYLR